MFARISLHNCPNRTLVVTNGSSNGALPTVGSVPPKRHTQHRRPDGKQALYYEELMGEEGFSSDSSLLYHRGMPSAIVDARRGSCPT